jgi:hypothetical protein
MCISGQTGMNHGNLGKNDENGMLYLNKKPDIVLFYWVQVKSNIHSKFIRTISYGFTADRHSKWIR